MTSTGRQEMRIACYIDCHNTFRQVQEAIGAADDSCELFTKETDLLIALRRQSFDLIVVDTDGPGALQMCAWLGCRTDDSIPLVLLSPNWTADQIANALDSGAEDVVLRPVATIELRARVHAVLRRYGRTNHSLRLEIIGFTLNRSNSKLLDRGVQVDLTPREFALAWLFFSSPGVYLARSVISAMLWGVEKSIANRTIEQHVYRLRKKLNLYPQRGAQVRAVYNKGYRLEIANEYVQNAAA